MISLSSVLSTRWGLRTGARIRILGGLSMRAHGQLSTPMTDLRESTRGRLLLFQAHHGRPAARVIPHDSVEDVAQVNEGNL